MIDNEILAAVKIDLQITSAAYDSFLLNIISAAKSRITTEGITLTDTVDDGMLVEMYAAWLYRKRRENVGIPAHLRWALNNRLFAEKAGAE